jgi:hypothetical protein
MNVRLDILAWLLVPLAVTILAFVVVRFWARPKGPANPHESVAERERFRQAMARPLPRLDPRVGSTPNDSGIGTVLIDNSGLVDKSSDRSRPQTPSERGAA